MPELRLTKLNLVPKQQKREEDEERTKVLEGAKKKGPGSL